MFFQEGQRRGDDIALADPDGKKLGSQGPDRSLEGLPGDLFFRVVLDDGQFARFLSRIPGDVVRHVRQ